MDGYLYEEFPELVTLIDNQLLIIDYLNSINSYITFIIIFGCGIAILSFLWWVVKQFIYSY
jgi:hypothetical protein